MWQHAGKTSVRQPPCILPYTTHTRSHIRSHTQRSPPARPVILRCGSSMRVCVCVCGGGGARTLCSLSRTLMDVLDMCRKPVFLLSMSCSQQGQGAACRCEKTESSRSVPQSAVQILLRRGAVVWWSLGAVVGPALSGPPYSSRTYDGFLDGYQARLHLQVGVRGHRANVGHLKAPEDLLACVRARGAKGRRGAPSTGRRGKGKTDSSCQHLCVARSFGARLGWAGLGRAGGGGRRPRHGRQRVATGAGPALCQRQPAAHAAPACRGARRSRSD